MDLNLFIPLVVYGRSFFQLSAEDSARLAKRTLELSSPSDSIVDLLDLFDLVWRKNRDEETIEESPRLMPICFIVDDLPEEFLISDRSVSQSRGYKELFRLQEPNEKKEYDFFISEKDRRRVEAQMHGDQTLDSERYRRPDFHTHHHHEDN